MSLDRSKRQGRCRTSALYPFADVRRSRPSRHRNRTGRPTIRHRRIAPSSTGRKLRRFSAQASPVVIAKRDAVHGSRNQALHRFPRSSEPQSHGDRTCIARATSRRRNIEAQGDRRTNDRQHPDLAGRAIEAAICGGYVCSPEVNGVRVPLFKLLDVHLHR
jgi:hypothetical protein